MQIEILCTGDEIVTGKTTNTNYSHIAQRLTENGLNINHGTTVGDSREALQQAFLLAAKRADAVIVNGGLGPTVDDLSQQVAADAAGVGLELHAAWLDKLKRHYESRGRIMQENNTKQAMLPAGSELLDNPIGTACGFALKINHHNSSARFFFTPGVPREMKRMVDEQVLPRLLAMRGTNTVTKLKRFHTFGIGESRADQLLADIIPVGSEGSIKLGFQTHFPQLETKLTVQSDNEANLNDLLEPVATALRTRLGHSIICEDDQTLESVILDALQQANGTLSCMEMATGGAITNRLMNSLKNKELLRCCEISPVMNNLARSLNLVTDATPQCTELAAILAEQQLTSTGSTHSLVVLTDETQTDTNNLIACIAVAGPKGTRARLAVLPGRPGWTRLSATELSLDFLRRYLIDLPLNEKIDFENDNPTLT